MTRVEVVTDGILTRRIQRDPELQRIGLVVFDEFHERHLQADLGLALTLDARQGLRPDLRVLVMSATLDAAPVAALLDGSPVITSRGHTYPVIVRWAAVPSTARLAPRVATAITRALEHDAGDVLTFLPGVGEIRAVASALGSISEVEILPLHGGLSPEEQDRVLRPGTTRRIVLSTDLAETSVTVEGVGVVVDAGLVRRPAYEPATGLTRLRTGLASRAATDQRAGRAGRTGPGVAYRLWTESSHLARSAWPAPEITNVDLAALVLELAVWGAPPAALRWLDAPPPAALAIARPRSADASPNCPCTQGLLACCSPRQNPIVDVPRCSPRSCPSVTSSRRRAATRSARLTSRRDSRSWNETTTTLLRSSIAPRLRPCVAGRTNCCGASGEDQARIGLRPTTERDRPTVA
jgi:ATP-dependent helicase HrpB